MKKHLRRKKIEKKSRLKNSNNSGSFPTFSFKHFVKVLFLRNENYAFSK